MITRRALLGFLLCMGALPAAAQQAKVWRVGYLGITAQGAPISMTRLDAFRTGLRELGYVEGRNIVIEYRWADGKYERLPALAEELVRAKVDVLVTFSTPGALAAKKATQSIPIVLASVGDPVATGLVSNLARPGGNITGLAMFTPDEMAKRLELLKDAFPGIRRVAILMNPENPGTQPSAARVQHGAARSQVEVQFVNARRAEDFDKALAEILEKKAEAVAVYEDPIFTANAKRLVALTIRHRLPTIGHVSFAEAGGLIGNGVNQLELFRRAAGFVDKILKGAKAGDLPIEQPARFELIVNQTTATALGVTLPKAFLFRADRIVD